MEVRDPIHGEIALSAAEEQLIKTAAYRRLRFIKQLGLSEYSFPGATHTRFLHSLGVCHLAEKAFNHAFEKFKFSSERKRLSLLHCVRAAALLHDIGHGPLSHSSEEVMPPAQDLDVQVYKKHQNPILCSKEKLDPKRQANHEDYTIKFITDSHLSQVLQQVYPDMQPLHIACLIDKTLQSPDDFFKDRGFDFQVALSQIVSSEIDVDRMDYLERDAYYCGVSYGNSESAWILRNLTYHPVEDSIHLALNQRAIYAFDDLLLSRYHIHLTVYFHHKAIVYEEMLHRYLRSPECDFKLPADIEQYTEYTDQRLYQHLAKIDNIWAQRIAKQNPFMMAYELHATHKDDSAKNKQKALSDSGIDSILSSSEHRLSKYYSPSILEQSTPIFVIDQHDPKRRAFPIEYATEIFNKYENARRVERLYVAPENLLQAKKYINTG